MFIKDIEIIVKDFCHVNGLSVKLSYDMPIGYETAYGTYDVTINTLFINAELLKNAPRHEVLFYLFHELRHAMQYLCPNLFSEQIQESRFYVVLYNGTCYKLVDNEWRECILEGSEEYFTRVYTSLPYVKLMQTPLHTKRLKKYAVIRRNYRNSIPIGCPMIDSITRSIKKCSAL